MSPDFHARASVRRQTRSPGRPPSALHLGTHHWSLRPGSFPVPPPLPAQLPRSAHWLFSPSSESIFQASCRHRQGCPLWPAVASAQVSIPLAKVSLPSGILPPDCVCLQDQAVSYPSPHLQRGYYTIRDKRFRSQLANAWCIWQGVLTATS